MAVDHVSCATGRDRTTPTHTVVCFFFCGGKVFGSYLNVFCLFLTILSIFVSVLVYYLRSKSRARIEMVKLLKEMLYIEAKDKEFLLANITRVTQNNGSLNNLSIFYHDVFEIFNLTDF